MDKQRNFPVPSFPISLVWFYKEKPRFWLEPDAKQCQRNDEKSFISKKLKLIKRFPKLTLDYNEKSLSVTRDPAQYMRITKEKQHKIRTLSPLPNRKVFKPTNIAEARKVLIRNFKAPINSPFSHNFSRLEKRMTKSELKKKFTPSAHNSYLSDNRLYLNSINSFESFEKLYQSSVLT